MRQSDRRSALFLTELIINVSLFVVCAAVCVALLVHARAMSMESQRLTYAVCLAQSAAEEWRDAEGPAAPREAAPDEQGLTVTTTQVGEGLDVAVYCGDELIYELKGVRRLG